MAGCSEESERVLVTLANNAVTLNRYEDASYYFWLVAQHHLQLAQQASVLVLLICLINMVIFLHMVV